MSKHTPGPWTAEVDRKNVRDGQPMAIVIAGGDRAMDVTGSGDTWDEVRANARLVAAAPEMYEALTDLLVDAEDFEIAGNVPKPTWDKIKAAIRKAHGSKK